MIKMSLQKLLPNDLNRIIVVEIFTLMNDKFDVYLSHPNQRFIRTLKTVLYEFIKLTQD